MMNLILTLSLLSCWISSVLSHGYLYQPPGRSSKWRRGFGGPENYDDNGLRCGSAGKPAAQCGLCGDQYDAVRDHETGGKYATGIITQAYQKGQKATFEVNITASHLGWFEFKICPRDSSNVRETQECFNTYTLSLANEPGTRYSIPQEAKMYYVEVMLPPTLTCEFCVLQWHYSAVLTDEEYYNCADIKIGGGHSGSGPQVPVTTGAPEVRPTEPNLAATTKSATKTKSCRAFGVASVSWCVATCYHVPPDCPPNLCECD